MSTQGPAQSGLPPDPLAQLRDIHLPQEVSWWPPAPGWWLLAILLVAGIAWLVCLLRQRRARRAYRRAGETELQSLFSHWQASGDTTGFLQELNALLKRVALHSFPADDVAAMAGPDWTAFLDRHWRNPGSKRFSGGPLEYGPYAPAVENADVATLYETSLRWLREHREQTHA